MALPRHDGGRTMRPRSFATALVERVPKSERGDMCDHGSPSGEIDPYRRSVILIPG